MESLFFTFEAQERKEKGLEEQGKGLVTIDTEKTTLESGLSFFKGGETGRRLTFEKDSMALQALQEGRVDFADRRI